MIAFNLSVDFELGWGDLDRLAYDDVFYRRVVCGSERSQSVIELLSQRGIPSTWGVVGGCCCSSVDELREAVPQAFFVVDRQLEALTRRRVVYSEVLFCPDKVEAIARSSLIELGSHSFTHLVPTGLQASILQDDVAASVRVLSNLAGRSIVSFIPPKNYHWPDEAFNQSSIKFVRHTPDVYGQPYSDPHIRAKAARLWNDFVRPADHFSSTGERVRLCFLRVDRGRLLWEAQLLMLRRLLASGNGSLFCYIHPHNLDTSLFVQRFLDLCDVIEESKGKGKLVYRKFFRELHYQQYSSATR